MLIRTWRQVFDRTKNTAPTISTVNENITAPDIIHSSSSKDKIIEKIKISYQPGLELCPFEAL